jgi:hypothetical protein
MPPERPVGFQLCGELEAALEIGGVEIEDREKILARLCHQCHQALHHDGLSTTEDTEGRR